MLKYITNQTKLASKAGITPEHLSGVKTGNKQISVALATLLASLTGMSVGAWIAPSMKDARKKDLKKFFLNQKKKQKEATH